MQRLSGRSTGDGRLQESNHIYGASTEKRSLANECSYRCFTKTIIPPALTASESIAHSAFMGFWVRVHSGSRNNC